MTLIFVHARSLLLAPFNVPQQGPQLVVGERKLFSTAAVDQSKIVLARPALILRGNSPHGRLSPLFTARRSPPSSLPSV